MRVSVAKVLSLLPHVISNRQFTVRVEHSERLCWLIIEAGKQQMCITFFDGKYRISTKECYLGVGYMQALIRTKSTEAGKKAISTYFSHGYKKLFAEELSKRSKGKEKGMDMTELKHWMKRQKYNASRRKTKPLSLEIPPSLKDQVKNIASIRRSA